METQMILMFYKNKRFETNIGVVSLFIYIY